MVYLLYIQVEDPDKNDKRNGGDIVAQVLEAHGVKQIFTLCGGHISPILVASQKCGIRVVDTRHEVGMCNQNRLKLTITNLRGM